MVRDTPDLASPHKARLAVLLARCTPGDRGVLSSSPALPGVENMVESLVMASVECLYRYVQAVHSHGRCAWVSEVQKVGDLVAMWEAGSGLPSTKGHRHTYHTEL